MLTRTRRRFRCRVINYTSLSYSRMTDVHVGVIGLGNVGSGALEILASNADQIALKLGFRLRVAAVCSRSVASKQLPAGLGDVTRTADWRDVVSDPRVDVVAELVGGTTTAREIIDAAIENGKSVVTANKELMALCGADVWDRTAPSISCWPSPRTCRFQ